jgi:integrase
MHFRLVKPVNRKGTTNKQFAQRIPADLRDRLVGMTLEVPRGGGIVPITITDKMRAIRFSLGSSDKGEAKQRQAEAITYLEGVYRNLRSNAPISLTHRQCVALAGELYRSWASDLETSHRITLQQEADGSVVREYGMDLAAEAGALTLEAGRLADLEGADLERHVGPLVGKLLLRRGIVAVDMPSREMLLPEFAKALAEGMAAGSRKAQSDYRADPNSERFPAWSQPVAAGAKDSVSSVSLQGLFDDWWKEAERAGKSISAKESFGKAVSALGGFLGHDDANRITSDDIVRFKEHLLSVVNPRTKKGLSLKTIGGSYLGGLNVVFKWAVENKRIATNPVESVKVPKGKTRRTRDTWFTPEERKAILGQASAAVRGKKEPSQRFAGRRWVPWLCAYSGARVGEMVQLRKQDLRQESGIWVMRITPEAVTVKTGQLRDVPLHPHLVEMGFPEFVQTAPDGPLFMWSGDGREAWRTAKNRLREAVRKVVPDANVQPNHGWRHTFKTLGREAGIQDYILDAITGHAPRTEGDKYGGATIKAKAAAMEMFPRYDIK